MTLLDDVHAEMVKARRQRMAAIYALAFVLGPVVFYVLYHFIAKFW